MYVEVYSDFFSHHRQINNNLKREIGGMEKKKGDTKENFDRCIITLFLFFPSYDTFVYV